MTAIARPVADPPTDRARCVHEMVPIWCAWCSQVEPPPALRVVRRFTAGSRGKCSGCDRLIEIGQRIARMADHTYLHEECAP